LGICVESGGVVAVQGGHIEGCDYGVYVHDEGSRASLTGVVVESSGECGIYAGHGGVVRWTAAASAAAGATASSWTAWDRGPA